jgi:hypothetical protein
MSRLLAFGCSFTYGHGLEDCATGDWQKDGPSKFGWPSLLAKKLDLEVVNKSRSGSSNKEIWNTILETEILPTDLIFINWTYENRTYFNGEQLLLNGNTAAADGTGLTKKEKLYIRHFYNEDDHQKDRVLRMDHIDSLYKCYHLAIQKKMILDNTRKWNRAKFLNAHWADYINEYPKALDGGHPGPEAHKHYADAVYSAYINQDYCKKES